MEALLISSGNPSMRDDHGRRRIKLLEIYNILCKINSKLHPKS